MSPVHHRSGGPLFTFAEPGFVESKEAVRGRPEAERARNDSFCADRIPLDAEGKRAAAPPAPAVMGALLPRTEKTPIRQRPAHVEERIDQEPAMARPVSDDHAGAIAQLREMLPAARKAILATIPYYDVNHSRRAALSKDLAALGTELNEETELYHLVERAKGEAAPTRRAKPRRAKAAADGVPVIDWDALPLAVIESLVCDGAIALGRRTAAAEQRAASVEERVRKALEVA
jgi:hypothetical protein